ncbi:TetR/AcrR family transcriptional regulator [Streptomyces sp. NPDC001914]|uniref:TetR/AcrR family transcriptional regulator n=1 Tax=Streptomyces sp. NPDC001914 TaxID=3364623 RepID=UPI003690BC91
MAAPKDRAAAVRGALRTLVADHGFHGASMSAVAKEAGVATGTAYTHYASKDALVVAAYCETKADLAVAITAGLDLTAPPQERFHAVWLSCYHYLTANPVHARFLLQVEHSPYRLAAHEAALTNDNDPLLAQVARPDMAAWLVPLPLDVLYELALSPAVRLAAGGVELAPDELDLVAEGCWRAISKADST